MGISSDEKLLETLLQIQNHQKLDYFLYIKDRIFPMDEAQIIKSSTPLNQPTYRGGVYFSNTFVYRIEGKTYDSTIIPLLSKTMLGPSTEFEEILITTNAKVENKQSEIALYTNLTNSMQSSSIIKLNLTINRAEIR